MLEHGGRLRTAAQQYGIPLADWLDLSTGINPHAYPLPSIPADAWQRLPETQDGLEAAAAAYYGSPALLPVAGSQAAIQALARVLPARRVCVLAPSYNEHAHAWRACQPSLCTADELDRAAAHADVLVVVNPNNPTGVRFPRQRLLDWHARLARRGGWLVVDEAFADADPADSLLPLAGQEGLVVLRSLGKFFGLAGARVGFVFAPQPLRDMLAEHLGPWCISGPARWIARQALTDLAWQAHTRDTLKRHSQRLHDLLSEHGLAPAGGSALFQWVPHPQAAAYAECFARQGILVRHFTTPSSLRFGLPVDEAAWQRLAQAFARRPHFV